MAVVALLVACQPDVIGGVIGASDDFSGWMEGYKSRARLNHEISGTYQPLARQFMPCTLPCGARLRFDGNVAISVRGPIKRDLDFDLPVDSMGRSYTISFGPALFKLDLPFLSFDDATATYSFKESWQSDSLSDAVFGEGEIRLTDIDAWAGYIASEHRNVYDVEGHRLDGAWAAMSGTDAHLMFSPISIGNEGSLVNPDDRVSAFGGMSLPEQEGELSSEAGLVGIVAMVALAGVALFITLEITRDKFDRPGR